MSHQKHAQLKSNLKGHFGHHELAILGTTCEEVEQLVHVLAESSSGKYRLGYVDADHKSLDGAQKSPLIQHLAQVWTNHQQWEVTVAGKSNAYERKLTGQHLDLVLINGNHEAGLQQMVVLNEKKINSLRKRWPALTDVLVILEPNETSPDLILLKEDILKVFPQAACFRQEDKQGWLEWFQTFMLTNRPALQGLILAGGRSERMGQDKGALDYHGRPQREYITQLLESVVSSVIISGRSGQFNSEEVKNILTDEFLDLGPYGALLTAFKKYPEVAWLVVAIDMPKVDIRTLEYLINHRNPAAIATAFINPLDGFPDPTLSIWEPKSYYRLLQFLSLGISCPRKVLINSDTELLTCPEPEWLTNINTPEELKVFRNSK